jgi:translocation and assembly module TamA
MTPETSAAPWRLLVLALRYFVWLTVLFAAACKERPPKLPGETDVLVASVTIEAADAATELTLEHGDLFERLGERPGSLINPDRAWSPFKEAEDRRRIEAYWQQRGFFEVEVSPAKTTFDEDGKANVVFAVREGPRFTIGDVVVELAPPEELEALRGMLRHAPGDVAVDLEESRKARIDMQEYLRRRTFGHANVYHRAYVDRAERKIHLTYFVDAGPKTVISSLTVTGNVKIPAEDVLRRGGLEVGMPYSEELRETVVRDLLDTGAYAAAYVRVDTDTKFIAPGTAPDSGGELRDEQVDAEGDLVPRTLPDGVNVKVHVVESPSQTLRLRAGFEIDPARADTFLTATLWLRNLFGPAHHLVLEGRAGFGWLFGSPLRERVGPYGEATLRTVHPGVLGRLGDLRTTIRYVGDLYPSAFLHRAETGVGARTTIDRGVLFDVDVFGFVELTEGFGPFTPEEQDALALPEGDLAIGPELRASFVYDRRDDPIEPMRGGFIGLFARVNPLATDAEWSRPYVNLAPDLRGFIPLTRALTLAGRGFAEWSLLDAGDGPALGARLFGGGAYGFRGFGRQRLSPTVTRCFETFCSAYEVGGRSLVESSVELRFLPPQKPIGAIVFADLGGASGDANPFRDGPSVALGAGARLRIWYLPAAIDVSYRIVHEGDIQGLDRDPFHVFFRIGEAF